LRNEGKLGSSEGKILDLFDGHMDGTALTDGITDGRTDGMTLADGMVFKDESLRTDCMVLTDGFTVLNGRIFADGMALTYGSVLSDGTLPLTDGMALTNSLVFSLTGDGMTLTDGTILADGDGMELKDGTRLANDMALRWSINWLGKPLSTTRSG